MAVDLYIYISITLTLMLAQGRVYLPIFYAEIFSLQHKFTVRGRVCTMHYH